MSVIDVKLFWQKHRRFFSVLMLCLSVWGFAYTYRGVLAAKELHNLQVMSGGSFKPYAIEGGIMYGYVRRIANGETVAMDTQLPDVNASVAAQMSLGLERFLGYGLKVRRFFTGTGGIEADNCKYEDSPAETEFMRKQLLAWICLIPAGVSLLLLCSGSGWWPAFIGGVLNAVAVAAMARYTGENLLKGNFAFPILVWILTCQCAYITRPRRWKLLLISLLTYMAAANWDATQLFLGLWGLVELGRLVWTGEPCRRKGRVFLAVWCGLLLAGACSPYGRLHNLLLSPAVMAVYPLVLVGNFSKIKRLKFRILTPLLLLIWYFAAFCSQFGADYSHFTELFWAKLQYLNVKPSHPGELNFSQRYLWTPALNSTSFAEFRVMFPWCMIPLAVLLLIGASCRFWRRQWAKIPFSGAWVVMWVIYTWLFILFFRFSIFAALFYGILIALAVVPWYKRFGKIGKIVIIVLLLALVVWPEISWRSKLERKQPSNLQPAAELVAYLRTLNLNNTVILANMDTGGMIKGYCNAAIVVQPKFELAAVRKTVEEYTTLLFDADESKFAAWCGQKGIKFFIYSRGTADWSRSQELLVQSGRSDLPELLPHIYSARYMADCLILPHNSIAYKAEFTPLSSPYLSIMAVPNEYQGLLAGYYIFKVITAEDRFLAEFDADEALAALADYDFQAAARLAYKAYYSCPSEYTYQAYCRVFGTYPQAPTLDIYLKDAENLR